MKKTWIKVLTIVIICAACVIFTANNYSFYENTIGTVTEVTNTYEKTRTKFDGKYEHKEIYYVQDITLKIRNGEHKGEEVKATS